ncbi:YheC/YheD family protein [Clostridium sp. OS1-26]|uniref:YheC/YheD family endospore coat-associated protein n=1 Tax=Clostridium sp. OS1-26 TaxID=3070681 RepID=UPI0027E165E2|nr:YheC/YheD family protein [Clostridium sp. OS1-26]WML33595.1 YheC/YheD family protein [Clostridium sp. OS1-26]
MEVQIKKLSENVDSNICYMPNDIFALFKLSKKILYKLHLGQSYEYSYIMPKEEHNKCMYFSNSVFKKLLLFEGITLNIWKNGDDIYLGPVVGVFVNPKFTTTIKNGKPSFFTQKHAEAGNKANCLSYFYSIEEINWDEGKIKGYTFVQNLNKWRCDWFPMPDVIYDRGVNFNEDQKPYVKYMKQQFRANNVHFINSPRYLSKWKVYECLSKYLDVNIYLPKTTIYRSFSDVLSMLNEYEFIFVKASNGSLGKQVLSIEQIDKKYKLNFNEHGLKEIILKEIEDVKMFVEKFVEKFGKERQFVVQQGIRLLKYNGRNMDIRVLMLKDRQGKWKASHLHCRIAKKTYTITNNSLGAAWEKYEKAYPYLSSPFSKRSIPDKEELINATKKVLYYYEKEFGSFGEIGMDMAVDIYGDIWFIEANTRPDKLSSPKGHDPKKIPFQAISIFEYAKFLASKVTTYTK